MASQCVAITYHHLALLEISISNPKGYGRTRYGEGQLADLEVPDSRRAIRPRLGLSLRRGGRMLLREGVVEDAGGRERSLSEMGDVVDGLYALSI
jgi:hypothetical protein